MCFPASPCLTAEKRTHDQLVQAATKFPPSLIPCKHDHIRRVSVLGTSKPTLSPCTSCPHSGKRAQMPHEQRPAVEMLPITSLPPHFRRKTRAIEQSNTRCRHCLNRNTFNANNKDTPAAQLLYKNPHPLLFAHALVPACGKRRGGVDVQLEHLALLRNLLQVSKG